MGALKITAIGTPARLAIVLVSVALLGAAAPSVLGDTVVVMNVVATSADGTGSYQLVHETGLRGTPWCEINWEGQIDFWNYNGPGEEDDALIATLYGLGVCYDSDPAINLHFSVQAGRNATTFTITSALQAVNPPIPAELAQARATSGFLVTEGPNVQGGQPGATLAGLEAGPTELVSYLAQYNGMVPTGSTFSGQINSIVVDPGRGTNRADVNDPGPTGYRALGAAVRDMSAEISFSLTPRDLASGDTTYELMPEPGALALLAVGAAALLRRRRL